MSDPAADPMVLGLLKGAAAWLWAVVLGLFGWLGKRHISRLDGIEAAYVPREVFDRTVTDLRAEIKQGNSETHRRLDELMMLLARQGQRAD